MNPYHELESKTEEIAKKIGHQFRQYDHLIMAFIHRSFINENRTLSLEHNERLEFLGDSVLGLSASKILYELFPEYPEGILSQLRSRLVDVTSCALFMKKLGVNEYILLGKGEEKSDGKNKASILANVFEAIIAAIFLDAGFDAAKQFIETRFQEEMREMMESPSQNYKAKLQDYSQKKFQKPPLYRVIKEEGPDHAKVFHVKVYVGDQEMGEGVGSSKKDAEQKAAKSALSTLSES